MEDILLKIDEKEFNAKFDKDDYANIIINGKHYHIELLKKYSENIFTFAVNQKLMQVELELVQDENLLLSLDGLTYEISITNETKKLLAKFLKSGSSGNSSGNIIKAPMPGMIVKILVEKGAEIAKGDKLIIIEAMKMENALTSPVSGIIKTINAVEGTAVEKDTVLIEIEMY
ncbi:MAG: acetyl-CoA carboxylase biotin carboxyl carrier protein subunit [FCB group bacterium]|jgi:biotin carboxyl carrier protein